VCGARSEPNDLVPYGESARTITDLGDGTGKVIALPFRKVCWPLRREFTLPDARLTGIERGRDNTDDELAHRRRWSWYLDDLEDLGSAVATENDRPGHIRPRLL
jgi:hypothetical protein